MNEDKDLCKSTIIMYGTDYKSERLRLGRKEVQMVYEIQYSNYSKDRK